MVGFAAAIALPALFCACTGGGASVGGVPVSHENVRPRASNPIQHVVVIIQENRSFNNLFYGFPGAKTVKYGYDSANQKIKLQPIGFKEKWDIDHDAGGFISSCDGTGSIPGTDCRNNGFDREHWTCGYGASGSGHPCPIEYPPYAYVPHKETKPYFSMAKQYALADRMYASNFDGSSFASHQYIIAAQAERSVNYPLSAWGCPGGSGDQISEVGPDRQLPYGYEVPCWNPTTLGDELDAAGVSWAYYATSYYASSSPGIWSAYQAIKHIYDGKDWKSDVISQPSQILTDITAGNLRAVNWVTPTLANSDHPGSNSTTGPSWVASVVNAIGTSQYWNSTAIFVFWDDYGGWYDPLPPPYEDYDGLGMRIPMIVISAYAKKGYVSHTQYEHGSILKFIENLFALAPLSASDERANSPTDCFDFTQPPRTFTKIEAPFGADFFLHQRADHRAPDAG